MAMLKEREKTLSRLIESFRDQFQERVDRGDLDPELHRALGDIDQTLGLIERKIADLNNLLDAEAGVYRLDDGTCAVKG